GDPARVPRSGLRRDCGGAGPGAGDREVPAGPGAGRAQASAGRDAMSDEREPNDRPDDFSEEDLRRLGSWNAPVPPADFTARVMSRDRAQASSAAGRPATS